MTLRTDICNWALYKLGESRVNNIETDLKESARVMNQLYPLVRDSLVQKYPWNFCLKRAALAASSDTPAWGYKFKYQLPSDCIALFSIKDDPEFVVEEGYILTDTATTLYIRYHKRVTNESCFSPAFNETFACKLAIEACDKITNSGTKKDALYQEYSLSIKEAYVADAIEGSSIILPESNWLEARV